MKAIILNAPGGVEQLTYVDLPTPEIGDGDVLVRVKAISINPIDTKVREGHGLYTLLSKHNPVILGWDMAGIVTESRSDRFKPGDAVFGMVNFPGHGKAYAEYVAAPANQLALKPESVSFEEAAATTLAALTAWQALVNHANVQKGQKVLIHAAAGGVGHFAVQLAKHLGAHVTGTSSATNKAFVLSLGADRHIDYNGYAWEEQEPEYDFVLDAVGGSNVDHSIAVTKPGGTVISIPTTVTESATANDKGIRCYFILVKSSGDDMHHLAECLAKGILKPYVASRFDFSAMREAHQQIETGRTVGKVVLSL